MLIYKLPMRRYWYVAHSLYKEKTYIEDTHGNEKNKYKVMHQI